MNLVYVDDVVDELIAALSGGEHHEGDFMCRSCGSYDHIGRYC